MCEFLTSYIAELMVYFEHHKLIEITKKVFIECAIKRPENVQEWIGLNIKRIASEIYHDCMMGGKMGVISSLNLSANFMYRVVIFGRPGSGRKTQALYLVKEFNVVYIDVEQLIYENLRGDDNNPYEKLAYELQRAFYYDNHSAKIEALVQIINRRLVQEDTLRRGWVIINFPHSLTEFKSMLQGDWKIPPNKIVFLKCSEAICIRRLLAKSNNYFPKQNFTYYEREMLFYKEEEAGVDKYLQKRHETIFINGECCSDRVKTQVHSLLRRTPYLTGPIFDTID